MRATELDPVHVFICQRQTKDEPLMRASTAFGEEIEMPRLESRPESEARPGMSFSATKPVVIGRITILLAERERLPARGRQAAGIHVGSFSCYV